MVTLDAYDLDLKEMIRAETAYFVPLGKDTTEEVSFAAALNIFMIDKGSTRTNTRPFVGKLDFPDLCHDSNFDPVTMESTSIASSTAESSTPPSSNDSSFDIQ
jgi:hypothetical protein